MKSIRLYVVIIMCCIVISSGVSPGLNSKSARYSDKNLIANSIIVDLSFDEPVITSSVDDEQIVQIITQKSLQSSITAGNPILPVKPLVILLPHGQTLEDITIELLGDIEVFDEIYPKQGSYLLPISKECSSKIHGFQRPVLDDKHIIQSYSLQRYRGFSLLFLTVRSVIYDTVLNELTYVPRMKISIDTCMSPDEVPVRYSHFDSEYISSIVENPECIDTYPVKNLLHPSDDTSYIIITSEELANSDLEFNFQKLIDSKINKGLSASIVTVEEIVSDPSYSVNGTWGDNNPSNPFYQHDISKNYSLFDDKAARIRNYIRYAYTELGTEYVLLGGDGDIDNEEGNIIPARGLFANESGLPLKYQSNAEEEDDIPSDVYYACLDGSFNRDMDGHFGESPDRNDIMELDEADLMAEVFVGRACVDSVHEVSHFVSKTLQYENSSHRYLSKILFAGEYLGFPGISAFGGNYKDLIEPLIPEEFNVVKLYDRDRSGQWNKNDIIEIINNATPHIINHDGHSYYGYNLKMYNSDVEKLQNENHFFLYSHGCMAGGFDNPGGYDCIAERLTVETPFGAFAAVMNSRYGLGSENSLDSPSQALDESFFKALYEEHIRQIGRANHYSKQDHIWHINDNGIRWVVYETNLFGDPELSIKDPQSDPLELHMTITKPEEDGIVYFKGAPLFTLPFLTNPLVIGGITIDVKADSNPSGFIHSVEFYLNDKLEHVDSNDPYSWAFEESTKGYHTLSVVAYDIYGQSLRSERVVYFFIP